LKPGRRAAKILTKDTSFVGANGQELQVDLKGADETNVDLLICYISVDTAGLNFTGSKISTPIDVWTSWLRLMTMKAPNVHWSAFWALMRQSYSFQRPAMLDLTKIRPTGPSSIFMAGAYPKFCV
jgi:hypothetical protein